MLNKTELVRKAYAFWERKDKVITYEILSDHEHIDAFRDLRAKTGKDWPLGKWGKTLGNDWVYLSTREDEQELLGQVEDKYYRIEN